MANKGAIKFAKELISTDFDREFVTKDSPCEEWKYPLGKMRCHEVVLVTPTKAFCLALFEAKTCREFLVLIKQSGYIRPLIGGNLCGDLLRKESDFLAFEK